MTNYQLIFITMFVLNQGKTEQIPLPRPASTDFKDGDLLAWNGNGQVRPANSSDSEYIGVMVGDVTSEDDDYSTEDALISVEIPLENHVRWEATASGANADDVGNKIDISDSQTVDRSSSSQGAVRVLGYVNADKLIVEFKSGF